MGGTCDSCERPFCDLMEVDGMMLCASCSPESDATKCEEYGTDLSAHYEPGYTSTLCPACACTFQCAACNGQKIMEVTHELDGTLAVVPTFDTCPTCDGTGTTADDLNCTCGDEQNGDTHNCRNYGCDDSCPACN